MKYNEQYLKGHQIVMKNLSKIKKMHTYEYKET